MYISAMALVCRIITVHCVMSMGDCKHAILILWFYFQNQKIFSFLSQKIAKTKWIYKDTDTDYMQLALCYLLRYTIVL